MHQQPKPPMLERHWLRLLAVVALLSMPAAAAVAGHSFSDVGSNHPFHNEIAWMSDEGISTGYEDGTFRPGADVSRQAAAAFLYGMAGSPAGPFPDPGFSDVDAMHPFYDQISWLADSGITGGYEDGTFRPGETVTRQASAAFLYRFAGEPDDTGPDPGFSDVGPTHPFHGQISWLADQQITGGYDDGTFRPGADVTRQAKAAFLYRSVRPPESVDALTLVFCDVGQADATIVQAGEFTMLVDAGHWQRSDVSECLDSHGVDTIEILALTHPHADHIGQAVDVLDGYEVEQVWRTDYEADSATFENYDQRVADGEAAGEFTVSYPEYGDSFEVDDHTMIDISYPNLTHADPDQIHDGGNLAFRVTTPVGGHGDASVLFTGDAEDQAEHNMVAQNSWWLEADVYQVGHHGSSTSTSDALVTAGEFSYAVWSAGADNTYGHPHAEPIQRLVDAGVEVYGTADHGTVTMTADATGWSVSTQTGAPPTDPGDLDNGNGDGPDPGCVDINSAGTDDLQEIVHIGPERAQQIVDLRPFADLDDLERVDGIGPARVQDIKDQGLACVGTG